MVGGSRPGVCKSQRPCKDAQSPRLVNREGVKTAEKKKEGLAGAAVVVALRNLAGGSMYALNNRLAMLFHLKAVSRLAWRTHRHTYTSYLTLHLLILHDSIACVYGKRRLDTYKAVVDCSHTLPSAHQRPGWGKRETARDFRPDPRPAVRITHAHA